MSADFSMTGSWLRRACRRVLRAVAVLGLCASAAAFAQNADLVLQHQDNPDPGPAGGLFTYTMRIDNNGPGAAAGVTLADTLPVGATFSSLTVSQGTCTDPGVGNGGAVNCTIGAIALNGFQTVAVTVRLPTAGTYTNNATVGSTTTDPNTANNSFAQTTTAVQAADLALAVITSTGTPPAGVPYTYTVTATNQGPNALEAGAILRISFTVPTGASASAFAGSGWSCTPAAPVAAGVAVVCSRTQTGGLAVGAAAPALTVTATANIAGTITANFSTSATRGDATTSMPDGDLSNNTATASVTSGSGTDVSITQAVSPNPVALGSQATFVLTPRLNGGEPPGATGTQLITVTNTLDPNLAFVSATGTGWTCGAPVAQVFTCTRPGPYTGGNFTNMPTITVVATATATGSVSNQAVISLPAGETDTVPGNNTSTATITSTNEADLRMNKSVDLNPVTDGETFNFRLSVTNLGPLATNAGQTITVTDVLPASVTLQAAPTGADWTCTPAAGFPIAGATVSCTRTLSLGANGTSGTITVPVRQTAGAVTNTASLALAGGGRVDANAGNDSASVGSTATVGATGSADLQLLSKQASAATTVAGQTLTYTIAVRNSPASPVTATNVVVTDALTNLLAANGLVSATFVNGGASTACPGVATPAAGPNQTVACNVGALAPGAGATVTLVVRPTVAVSGNRINTASVASLDLGDTDRSNNSGSVTTAVTAIVDLRATKTATPSTATPGTVPAGAPLTYTVTVINDGPSTAQTVALTDTLPTNAAFINLVSVSGGGTCPTTPAANAVGGTLVCNWGSIPNTEQRTVTYRVRALNAAVGGTVVNTVAATTTTPETTTANNGATTATAVTAAQLDVLVNKVDSTDPVGLGGLTTYTVTVTNNGPSYGTNVVLTDVFPAPTSTPTAVFSYQGAFTVDAGGTCTQPAVGATSGTISCTFPVLASGQVATVTYQMRAESLTVAGSTSGTLSSRASVTVTETETQLGNNVAIENTTTNRAAVATDLTIAKTVAGTSATPGSNVVYTLVVTNNGPLASAGAQVLDPLPAGLSFVSGAGCAAVGASVSCVVGNLGVGASQTFTVTALLANPFPGGPNLANTATVDAPGDTVPGNNSSTVTVPVNPSPPGSVAGIPTLSQWALIVMALLVAGTAAGMLRRPAGRG